MRSTAFNKTTIIRILVALLVAGVGLWFFFAPQRPTIRQAGKLLERQQIRLAFGHYERVFEQKSDSVAVLNALAWIQGASNMKGLANPAQSLTRALRACELTDYSKAEVLDTLAVAGRIRTRLALYEAGKVYRDATLTRDVG